MSSPSHRAQRFARLTSRRLAPAALALLLILLAGWGVLGAGRGLESRRLSGANGEPLRFLAPEGASGVPGVIIAHGFSGSTPFMLGFGQILARAGYGVMLLDFDGHGSARVRLDDGSLQRNLDAAYAALVVQPEIDPARVALLGHSMGSGAVMSAAIADAGRYRATVAVSPTGAAVSPQSPRNLLLMAGTLEPQFAANGRDLLARAGGANDDLAGGRGRAMVDVPNVEHITILFSGIAHQAALDLLNPTFDLPAATAASAVIPSTTTPPPPPPTPPPPPPPTPPPPPSRPPPPLLVGRPSAARVCYYCPAGGVCLPRFLVSTRGVSVY